MVYYSNLNLNNKSNNFCIVIKESGFDDFELEEKIKNCSKKSNYYKAVYLLVIPEKFKNDQGKFVLNCISDLLSKRKLIDSKMHIISDKDYYNLYNDTTAYFLTWNPLPVQGKRMSSFFETNSSSLPKETFHTEERLLVYSNEYSGGLTLGGYIQNTAFDKGEGWTGTIMPGQVVTIGAGRAISSYVAIAGGAGGTGCAVVNHTTTVKGTTV